MQAVASRMASSCYVIGIGGRHSPVLYSACSDMHGRKGWGRRSGGGGGEAYRIELA